MKERAEQLMPQARGNGLIVQELAHELLVYDRDRQKAHCLNQTAAFIWNHCDGATPVGEIAVLLEKEFDAPVADEVVRLGLDQLWTARLLNESIGPSSSESALSRREVLRRAGLAAAVALPLVTSILAPTASHAANCRTAGQSCTSSPQCCSNVCNANVCV